MHGSIEVRSAAGTGTSVRVTLPLRAASEYCPLAETHAEVLDTGAGRPLRILLAEDEAINQLAMRTLLERSGHEVALACNGQEVLELLLTGDFDCILMDVQMPVMSGVEATRKIRAMSGPKKNIPIIALTAHAMSGDRESFLEAGMDDYLPKPVGMTDLVNAIAKLRRASTAENG
jgi:CheY-like chemotaxis protein